MFVEWTNEWLTKFEAHNIQGDQTHYPYLGNILSKFLRKSNFPFDSIHHVSFITEYQYYN